MPTEFVEKTTSSEIVFEGKFFKIRRHQVVLPDGKKATREIAEHPGASACVVLNDSNEVLLVSQYRKAAEAVLLEIPAGKIDAGETPLQCVKREVLEETGVVIGEPTLLAEFYPTPGFTNEKMFVYIARLVRQENHHQMEDECISSEFVPLTRALEYIQLGKIIDAKTIIGLLLSPRKG